MQSDYQPSMKGAKSRIIARFILFFFPPNSHSIGDINLQIVFDTLLKLTNPKIQTIKCLYFTFVSILKLSKQSQLHSECTVPTPLFLSFLFIVF